MLLLDLPSELLICILEHLGSAFFQEDINRLRVCRRWFSLAHEILLSTFHLSRNNLRTFVSIASPANHSEALERSLRDVSLRISGSDEEVLQSMLQDPSFSNRLSVSCILWHMFKASGSSQFQSNVPDLAKLLQRCTNMRRLRIYTSCGRFSPSRFWPFHVNIPNIPWKFRIDLSNLLVLDHLTDLEIDTCGAELKDTVGHVCASLHNRLGVLKRLVLRMLSLCPTALTIPEGLTILPLEELTINLSMDRSPACENTPYTCWCGTTYPLLRSSCPRFLQLRTALEQQAASLVPRMRKARTVRILWQDDSTLHLLASDLLTGEVTSLGENARWNAQGEPIELASDLSDTCHVTPSGETSLHGEERCRIKQFNRDLSQLLHRLEF